MTLGIDCHRLCGRRMGVGRYLEYLLQMWVGRLEPFNSVRLFAPCALDVGPLSGDPKVREAVLGQGLPLFAFHNLLLPRHARALDLLFCPAYFAPYGYRGRFVVTHHGSYEAVQHTFPWWYRYRYNYFYADAARHAHTVITVSESSKRDIVRFYDVAPAKVRVIYYGVDPRFSATRDEAGIAAVRHQVGITDVPFLLYVGKLSARRSILPLLEAFAEAKASARLPHRLLLVGPNDIGPAVPATIARLNLGDAVRHLEYVGHDRLPALYQAADAFIYPSIYEGFGMPVVEAMASGTPVITLDNTAFRETAADAAYLAPDASIRSLVDAIVGVLSSSSLRAELSGKGVERARAFSWARCADETMEVLTEAATSGRP